MLPFELHVLEVAIGDVCAVCTELVKELESSSHPALDALTKHVRSFIPDSNSMLVCFSSNIWPPAFLSLVQSNAQQNSSTNK